ncbi:hypothetical protein ABPG72_015757 [Tetrahymena utriculariae]
MNSALAFALSIQNLAELVVQVFIVALLINKDSYSMLYAFLFTIFVDGLGLIYFLRSDNVVPNKKPKYLIFCFFQLEVFYQLIFEEVPMSTKNNIGYRAFREYIYVILNIAFVFTFQVNQSQTSYDIEINQFIILLTRLFFFSIYLFCYHTIKYQWMSFLEFIDANVVIFAYYLAIGVISTQFIGDEIKYNLGLIYFIFILSTNLISILYNIRYIQDNEDVNLLSTFLCSLSCNSFYKNLCSYGQVKPTLVFRYLSMIFVFACLIIYFSQTALDNLYDFLHLPLKQKFITSCSLISMALFLHMLLRYLPEFYNYAIRERSYYINCEDVFRSAIKDFNSKMFFTNQVDIIIKNNYFNIAKEEANSIEEKQLIQKSCQDDQCNIQYQFLQSISKILSKNIIVNIQNYNVSLCEYHAEELIIGEQIIYEKFLEDTLEQEKYQIDRTLIIIIKERFTNGFYKSELSQRIINKLWINQKRILQNMNSQAHQVFVFIKHQKQYLTILPELLLFDLYSLDT